MNEKTYFYIKDSSHIKNSFLYHSLVQSYDDEFTPGSKEPQKKAFGVIGEILSSMVLHQSSYNPEIDAVDVVTMLSDSLTAQSSEWNLLKNAIIADLVRIREELLVFLRHITPINGTVFNYATVDQNFSIWLQYSG